MSKFTAYVERDPDSGLYVGVVHGVPGAHTQAATIKELKRNLREVLELCVEDHKGQEPMMVSANRFATGNLKLCLETYARLLRSERRKGAPSGHGRGVRKSAQTHRGVFRPKLVEASV